MRQSALIQRALADARSRLTEHRATANALLFRLRCLSIPHSVLSHSGHWHLVTYGIPRWTTHERTGRRVRRARRTQGFRAIARVLGHTWLLIAADQQLIRTLLAELESALLGTDPEVDDDWRPACLRPTIDWGTDWSCWSWFDDDLTGLQPNPDFIWDEDPFTGEAGWLQAQVSYEPADPEAIASLPPDIRFVPAEPLAAAACAYFDPRQIVHTETARAIIDWGFRQAHAIVSTADHARNTTAYYKRLAHRTHRHAWKQALHERRYYPRLSSRAFATGNDIA